MAVPPLLPPPVSPPLPAPVAPMPSAASSAAIASAAAAAALPLVATATAYGLFAVIVHSGDSANSGHYFCFARRSEAPGADLRQADCAEAPWALFNDETVEPRAWSEVARAVAGGGGGALASAYALLYRRLDEAPGGAAAAAPTPAPALADWIEGIVDDNIRGLRRVGVSPALASFVAELSAGVLAKPVAPEASLAPAAEA